MHYADSFLRIIELMVGFDRKRSNYYNVSCNYCFLSLLFAKPGKMLWKYGYHFMSYFFCTSKDNLFGKIPSFKREDHNKLVQLKALRASMTLIQSRTELWGPIININWRPSVLVAEPQLNLQVKPRLKHKLKTFSLGRRTSTQSASETKTKI